MNYDIGNEFQKLSKAGVTKIIVTYSIVGGLWIYFSDTFLGLVITDPALISRLSIYKGFVFIALTAALLYVLIARYVKRIAVHVTERDQALLSLDQQKALLASVVEGTTDAIYIKGIDGRYLLANTAVAKVLNKPLNEIIGHDDTDLFPFNEAHALMAKDQWVMAQATAQAYEEQLTTTDGERFFSSTKGAICDGNGTVTGLFGVARDITDQKRAEEALQASEQEFRNLAEAMPQIVWVTGPDGWNLYFNQHWMDYTGLTLEESNGHGWNKPFHPDDQQRARDAWEHATQKGGSYSLECRLRRADGVYHWWLIRGVPVLDEQGAVLKWIGTCTDIDEFKKAEAEKQLLEQQFQQAQKRESLGVLTGGIAHDFNNILTIIIGHCSLAKIDPDSAESSIVEIEKAAQRAADLCRQMLAYVGKSNIVQVQVNFVELVDDMVQMLKMTVKQNATLSYSFSDDVPYLKGDISQLRQVVMNLIINASEAIGEEQGEVIVVLTWTEIRSGKSDVDYFNKVILPGWYVCLEVTDTGCGMDEETRLRLFEPFFTTKFTGRGLGMSAVLGIISAHKGVFQVFSQQGHGTTFKIYLPSQMLAAGDDGQKQTIPSEPWQGSGTILLVEDEDELRYLAKMVLNNFGFSVIEASNGNEALELYQKNVEQITLVITDMGMPVMDGFALVKELKKNSPRLPIVISSGFGDADIASRISHDDIVGLISKPYNPDELREVLKNVADDARAGVTNR